MFFQVFLICFKLLIFCNDTRDKKIKAEVSHVKTHLQMVTYF